MQELRLGLHAHDREAAFASALLTDMVRQHVSGFGDRPCMALAIKLGAPVATADGARWKLTIYGLSVEVIL